jgi:hypothetical protein
VGPPGETPRRWSERHGTIFTFTLNKGARVTLTFTRQVHGRKLNGKYVSQTKHNRHKPKCTFTSLSGTLVVNAHGGTNHVAFGGRLGSGRRLKPGAYTVSIRATDAAGLRSAARTLTFTILAN